MRVFSSRTRAGALAYICLVVGAVLAASTALAGFAFPPTVPGACLRMLVLAVGVLSAIRLGPTLCGCVIAVPGASAILLGDGITQPKRALLPGYHIYVPDLPRSYTCVPTGPDALGQIVRSLVLAGGACRSLRIAYTVTQCLPAGAVVLPRPARGPDQLLHDRQILENLYNARLLATWERHCGLLLDTALREFFAAYAGPSDLPGRTIGERESFYRNLNRYLAATLGQRTDLQIEVYEVEILGGEQAAA